MSLSPCSVPELLRTLGLAPLETPRQQEACRRHDEAYERGGDRTERLVADVLFGLDLLGGDPALLELIRMQIMTKPDDGAMAPDTAECYVWFVRMLGGSRWPGGDAPGALPPREPQSTEAP